MTPRERLDALAAAAFNTARLPASAVRCDLSTDLVAPPPTFPLDPDPSASLDATLHDLVGHRAWLLAPLGRGAEAIVAAALVRPGQRVIASEVYVTGAWALARAGARPEPLPLLPDASPPAHDAPDGHDPSGASSHAPHLGAPHNDAAAPNVDLRDTHHAAPLQTRAPLVTAHPHDARRPPADALRAPPPATPRDPPLTAPTGRLDHPDATRLAADLAAGDVACIWLTAPRSLLGPRAGATLSAAALRTIAAVRDRHTPGVPIVLDATRLGELAARAGEPLARALRTIGDVADLLVLSGRKDAGGAPLGLVSARDPARIARLRPFADLLFGTCPHDPSGPLALAAGLRALPQRAAARASALHDLGAALIARGAPLLGWGGGALFLDAAAALPALAPASLPASTLLALLYVVAGIRGLGTAPALALADPPIVRLSVRGDPTWLRGHLAALTTSLRAWPTGLRPAGPAPAPFLDPLAPEDPTAWRALADALAHRDLPSFDREARRTVLANDDRPTPAEERSSPLAEEPPARIPAEERSSPLAEEPPARIPAAVTASLLATSTDPPPTAGPAALGLAVPPLAELARARLGLSAEWRLLPARAPASRLVAAWLALSPQGRVHGPPRLTALSAAWRPCIAASSSVLGDLYIESTEPVLEDLSPSPPSEPDDHGPAAAPADACSPADLLALDLGPLATWPRRLADRPLTPDAPPLVACWSDALLPAGGGVLLVRDDHPLAAALTAATLFTAGPLERGDLDDGALEALAHALAGD